MLRGKVLTSLAATTRVGNNLVAEWETIKRGIKRAVWFLEEETIFDTRRLPTDVVVAPLAALWGVSPRGLDAEGEAQAAAQLSVACLLH